MLRWIKKNPKKTFVLLNLLVLIFLLIGFEWYLAGTSDSTDIFGTRFIRLREHPPGSVIRDRTLPKGSRLVVDENGFIEPSLVHDKPDLQIVFLGGSTTECLIVEEEKRFPYVVGRAIERQTGLKINTINCGCRGNNTAHSINTLFNKIVPFRPHYVILMHNVNDLVLLAYMGSYWNDHFTRSMIVKQGHGWFDAMKLLWINSFPNLYTFLRVKRILDFDALIHAQREDEWKAYRKLQTRTDPEAIKRQFATNLRAFISLCRTFGIRPVLMTQPNSGEDPKSVINKIKIKEMHPEFNEVIRYVAELEKVPLLDLAAEIRKPEYFYDYVHLNNYGSSVTAKTISQQVLALLRADGRLKGKK